MPADDSAKLQLKEGLKHVSGTRTSIGSVTKLAATTVFQVLICEHCSLYYIEFRARIQIGHV
jgi:hypothetical protein